jgi:hypothetical protein
VMDPTVQDKDVKTQRFFKLKQRLKMIISLSKN